MKKHEYEALAEMVNQWGLRGVLQDLESITLSKSDDADDDGDDDKANAYNDIALDILDIKDTAESDKI